MKKILTLVLAMGMLITWNVKDAIAQQLPPILNIGTHPVGSFYNIVDTAVATVVGKHTPLSVEGYLFRLLGWLRRILLCGGGIISMIPGWKTDLLGLAIALPIVFWEWKTNREIKKNLMFH